MEVRLEFCASCGYREKAVEVRDAIVAEFRNRVDVEIASGEPTSFELKANGKLLHSKLATSKFVAPAVAVELVLDALDDYDEGTSAAPAGAGAGSGGATSPAAVVPSTAGESKADEVSVSIKPPNDIGAASDMPTSSAPLFIRFPMFMFPYNVNLWAARIAAAFNCFMCIAICANIGSYWARVATAGLFGDFVVRFVLGPSKTIAGTVGYLVTETLKLRVSAYPGPPKQFAQFIGTMMTGAASLTLFLDISNKTNETIAIVILAVLAFFAFLEGFVNFCAGCWMFKILTNLNFIRGDPSKKCVDIADEFEYSIHYARQRVAGPRVDYVIRFPWLRLPWRYAPKTADHKKEDFDLVRHCTPLVFLIPMSILGCAAALKVAQQSSFAGVKRFTWIGVLYLGVISLCLLTLLYLAKLLLHPKKVYKDYYHPQHSSSLATWTISVLLLSLLLADELERVAEGLFWTAAPLHTLLTVNVLSRWVVQIQAKNAVNPFWMIAPLGNLIAALVVPSIDQTYLHLSYFFFAPGLIMWIVLFTVSLLQFIKAPVVPPMLRNGLPIFFASPAIAAMANRTLDASVTASPAFDRTSLTLYFFSLFSFFAFVLGPGSFSYLNRMKWHLSHFAYAFSFSALSLASTTYYTSERAAATADAEWSEFIAYAALGLSLFSTTVNVLQLIAALFRRVGVFVPEPDTSGFSFIMLHHFAFRNVLNKLESLSQRLATKSEEFVQTFYAFNAAYVAHAHVEDTVLFPELEKIYPGITNLVSHEHERDHADMDRMMAMCAGMVPALNPPAGIKKHESPVGGDVAGDVAALMSRIAANARSHMDHEEVGVGPATRKLIPSRLGKKIGRAAFNAVSPDLWRVSLPLAVNYMDTPKRRTAFLLSLQSAVPEHSSMIGHYLFEGVDATMWDRIRVDWPAMIPYGVSGHNRSY